MPLNNPQNPYRSFVVRASAGSGKTWQLSRRFLQLVAAGAHPGSILTVTFTRKAAAEMRERILDSAAQLLQDPSVRNAFAADLEDFYRLSQASDPSKLLPPPRSPEAAARLILASTQSLRIATIDAIFLEWIRKFPFEASAEGNLVIPPGFDLLSPRGEERLLSRAWSSLLKTAQEQGLLPQWHTQLAQDFHLLDIQNRLKELIKHESFLWLVEKQRSTALLNHPLAPRDPDSPQLSFIAWVESALEEIVRTLPVDRIGPALAAIKVRDLAQLQELKVLKGDGTVHGGTFKGKKRDQLAASIALVDESALAFEAEQKKSLLNLRGQFLFQIFQLYETERKKGKLHSRSLSFADLIKGGFHLFSEADAVGIRFLLHRSIHHLLLDEFQDTSILQWTVFRAMAGEMLAGKGLESKDHLAPTVFIVGDAKQSIYGFREAEAMILDEAALHLSQSSAVSINLSVSYRTSPLLLSLVNQVFQNRIHEFPKHETAHHPETGQCLVPGPASITIAPLFSKEQDLGDPIKAEAQFLAQQLKEWIHGLHPKRIFDKKAKQLRPLKAGDCAILYRAATQAAVYADAMRAQGCAVRMEEGQSFFERLEIRDLMAFCRTMANPSDTLSLVELLKSLLLAVPDALLLQALAAEPQQKEQSKIERHKRILLWLSERGQKGTGQLQDYLRLRQTLRPALLLQKFLQEIQGSARYAVAFGEEEGSLAQANGARFAELLFELEASGLYDWYPLLDRLDQMAAEKSIGLADVSSDAIQLMTIHKSKGLEFPLVMLVGTGEEWDRADPFWAKMKDHSQGTGVFYVGKKADQPTHDEHMNGIHEQLLQESAAENLRLLYVALTRAQYCLVVSGHQRKAGKPADRSFHTLIENAFLALGSRTQLRCGTMVQELISEGSLPSMPATTSKIVEERQAAWLLPALPASTSKEIRTLAPARLLESKATAHKDSHPYATSLGSFVHKGLEAAVKGEEFEAEKVWMSLRSQHHLHEYHMAFRFAQSKLANILHSPLWQELFKGAQQTYAEMPVAYIQDQQLVRGVIDLLIERDDQSFLVVDYKTVAEVSLNHDFKQLIADKKYDQQLALYVEAVRRLNPGKLVRASLLFTEVPILVELA